MARRKKLKKKEAQALFSLILIILAIYYINEKISKLFPKETSEETTVESAVIQPASIDEILNSPNIPQYYGSLIKAQRFSKNFADDVVVVKIDFQKYVEDKTILNIDGYEDEDSIRSIELYIKNSDRDMTLKEAYEAIYKFMPDDILSQFYREPEYVRYIPDKEEKGYYTKIEYSLKLGGSHNYQGQVTVIFKEVNNLCEYVTIGFGSPPWMLFINTKKNGYSYEKTDISIFE